VLNEPCLRFREDFAPGPVSGQVSSQAPGHEEACPACREWAKSVRSFRAAGSDVPLPDSVRVRLLATEREHVGSQAVEALGSLQQIPLPPELRAKLYRIPSDARLAAARQRPPAGSREMIAASLVFAALVTLGAGDLLAPVDNPKLAAVSGVAGALLKEAGTRGTQTLLGVGEDILDGFLKANRSLESLLGRVGETKREDPKASDAPAPKPPNERKENPHGSRPTH
jgi:hypothetical protein